MPVGITLGVVAGGQASRLGGLDKAWLHCAGRPLVLRCVDALRGDVDRVLVSANRALARYEAVGLTALGDRAAYAGCGPVAALDALAHACRSEWLVTVPVDVLQLPDALVPRLVAVGGASGAFAIDDDGEQPLVAAWPAAALRDALASIGPAAVPVRHLHALSGSRGVRFADFTFGNLNTPADLAAAGVRMAP